MLIFPLHVISSYSYKIKSLKYLQFNITTFLAKYPKCDVSPMERLNFRDLKLLERSSKHNFKMEKSQYNFSVIQFDVHFL